ncbi:MAG: (2Fe-2S)-binding protein [Planctomycetes bacterium]|nr:(2Fe-2S)-binding protein [Planctomycetota bacterium]
MRVRLTINGERRALDVHPAARLLDVLRVQLGLTGTKEGCGEGECGACTVLMDGLPVNSCLVAAFQADGSVVETVESVDPGHLTPLLVHGATQCGACTPGVVMTGEWVNRNRELLERFTLRELMAGNFCRCTGYDGIIEGVEARIASDESP